MAAPILSSLGTAMAAARVLGLGPFARFIRGLVDAVFLRVGRPPLHASFGGTPVRGYLRHRSFLAEAAQRGTTYRELFVRGLRPGLTVVDGGAHVGLYTVLASAGVTPGGTVFAFEPDPYNFRALEHNVERFARGNVHLSRAALADAPQEAPFYISSGTIGSSLFARGDTVAAEPVEVTTVDRALSQEDPRALLVRLNTEGAEPLVVAGMRETLERVEEVTLIVEMSPAILLAAGFDPDAFVLSLRRLGFRVFAIDLTTQTSIPLVAGAVLAKGHLFCARP